MEKSNILKYYNLPEIWNQEPTQHQLEIAQLVLSKIPKDVTSILDIGSGNGIITNLLAESFPRVCALDISEEALKYVRTEKVVGTIEQMPFRDDEFDLVLLSDVLEHLPNDIFERGTREVQRVAQKYVFIVTPFQEKLDFGKMTCGNCSCEFHVNLHIRSITLDTIKQAFSPKFHISEMSLAGDEWLHIPGYAKFLKSLYTYSNNWDHAVCPQCGETQNEINRVHHPIHTDPSFFNETVDLLHYGIDRQRLEEFMHNEALFLLERWSPESIRTDELRLVINTNMSITNVEFIAEPKWNLDLTNPFFERSHTVYFGTKPYLVTGDTYNVSDVISGEMNYRVVGPKLNGSNHLIFVIPKFTDQTFTVYVEYQDISTEPLLLNVFDRERSYIPLGELENKADGIWKRTGFEIPPCIKCPPEGFIFELTTRGTITDQHPVRYISVNGTVPFRNIIMFDQLDPHICIDLEPMKEAVVESNCFILCHGEICGETNFEAYLQVGDMKIDVRVVPVKEGYLIEVPAELTYLFLKKSWNGEPDVSAEEIRVHLQNTYQLNQPPIWKSLIAYDRLIAHLQKIEWELQLCKNKKAEMERRLEWLEKREQEQDQRIRVMQEKYEAELEKRNDALKQIENMGVLQFIKRKWNGNSR